MKTDEIPFTFVTAIVLTGVLLAVASPGNPNVAVNPPAAKVMAADASALPANHSAMSEPATTADVEVTE